MYYYEPDTNRTGKRYGLTAALLYLVMFVAVSLLVKFDNETVLPASEGILIDFGDDTDGTGEDNVALSQAEEAAAASASSQEEYLTEENDVPVVHVSEKNNNTQNSERTPQNTSPANNTSRNETEQREVNRRALFPGRSTTSEATSQGSGASSQGNAGNQSGGDGSRTGTGTGSEGISFNLSGRRPVGSLPRPQYDADAQGIVIVEITVDAAGAVQSASFRPQGSTTQNSRLVDAALRAARQAKFTPSEANDLQTGTITYVFRLQ